MNMLIPLSSFSLVFRGATLISCNTRGRRVTIPDPRGRRSRPTRLSSTELFPELCYTVEPFLSSSSSLDKMCKTPETSAPPETQLRRSEAAVVPLYPLWERFLAAGWWWESNSPSLIRNTWKQIRSNEYQNEAAAIDETFTNALINLKLVGCSVASSA